MFQGQEVIVCKNCGSNAVSYSVNIMKRMKFILIMSIILIPTGIFIPLSFLGIALYFTTRKYKLTPHVFKCQSCRKEIYVSERTLQEYQREVN